MTVVFADEVGFMMNPCDKATRGAGGPDAGGPYRNRHHKKVSAPGAIARNADGTLSVLIDLVWDNLWAHKSKLIKAWLADHRRLRVHYLPPYAPDLNPVDTLWSMVGYHQMANHAIDGSEELEPEARRHVATVSAERRLLRACFRSAELALDQSRAQ